MTSILIVDDDKLFSLKLEEDLSTLGYEVYKKKPRDSATAWAELQKKTPDIVLVDIHLEEKNAGLELAKKIDDIGLPYILMTIDQSDAVFKQAMELKPYSYLVKPFGKKRLHRTIQLVLSRFEVDLKVENDIFHGKNRNGELVRIPLRKIVMVEAIGNYCYLHSEGQRYSLRTSLSSFLKKLPDTHFIQIHRRYAVAISHIESLNVGSETLTVEGKELQIGGKFKASVLLRLRK